MKAVVQVDPIWLSHFLLESKETITLPHTYIIRLDCFLTWLLRLLKVRP